jgi:tripartite-type tricarboxylate transporter receptor subunit TctC
MVSTGPHVLVVTSKLPVKNTQELVAYAKANPGKLNFGSAGVGGLAHLGTELFKSMTRTDVVHVPYRGTSQVTKDLISGDVQALFSSLPSLKPLIDAGKIRALGLTAPSNSADAKGIPTIGASVPGFEYTTWYAVYAPPGTPKPIIDLLNSTLRQTLENKALRDRLDAQGVEVAASTPDQLRDGMLQETAKWRRVIRDANITAK